MNKREHLLVCLIEEQSEVIQAICKGLRFGLDDVYEDQTNLEYIKKELIDVDSTLELLEEDGVNLSFLDAPEAYSEDVHNKKNRVRKWMGYSKQRGCLDE